MNHQLVVEFVAEILKDHDYNPMKVIRHVSEILEDIMIKIEQEKEMKDRQEKEKEEEMR